MSETQPINDATQEELVAYLDGELEPQASRDVERRLATDPEYRQLLQLLSQAWDALDQLPHVQPPENFAGSTVAMVAQGAREEVAELKSSTSRRRLWGILAGISGMAVALLLGSVITAAILPEPDAALIEDLPVIENVDVYLYADDIEFLHRLEESGLFAGDVDSTEPAPATSGGPQP